MYDTYNICDIRTIYAPSLPLSVCLSVDTSVGNGVTQDRVDVNVMTVAEHWLQPAQREVVYMARFTGRVPYKVYSIL